MTTSHSPFALPHGSAAANPFAPPTFAANPFTRPAQAAGSRRATKTGYALIASAPDVNSSEVEDAHLAAMEVTVRWGDNTLCTTHLSPPRPFVLGEGGDYVLPEEVLGAVSFAALAVAGQEVRMVVPKGAIGTYDDEQGRTSSLEGVLAERGIPNGSARELSLRNGTSATYTFPGSEVSITVRATCSGKKLSVGFFSTIALGAVMTLGLSFVLHAALIGSFAFWMPTMDGDSGESIDRDQLLNLQMKLDAQAEREREKAKEESGESQGSMASAAGERAVGAEGAMGKNLPAPTQGHWAKQGPADNPTPNLSRAEQIAAARNEGIIGTLLAMGTDMNAPTAAWAPEIAQGRDAESYMGAMFGDGPGDNIGSMGLGMHGLEEGGGGNGHGVGLSDHGGVGGGLLGTCTTPGGCHGIDGDGSGKDHGKVPGNHKPGGFTMRTAPVTSDGGRLGADVIQRIVRMNNGRFRSCYESGLRTNPSLAGRVTTKFVIGRDGAVSLATDGGSDLPNPAVVSCVTNTFRGLSFPVPEGGAVRVTYPISFSPE